MYRFQVLWIGHIATVIIAVAATCVRVASGQNPPGSREPSVEAEFKAISSDAAGLLQREIDRTLNPDSGGGRNLQRIDPVSLARMGSDTQRFLMTRLNRPEFAAMKDYVAHLFPRPPSADHVDPVLGTPAVSRPVAVEYSRAISALVKRLGANPLAVTLTVTSAPAEADIELRTAAVQGPRSRTNATLMNVYRGLYDFRMTKALYKPAVGKVNLVDDDRPNLECLLALAADAHNDSSCRRR